MSSAAVCYSSIIPQVRHRPLLRIVDGDDLIDPADERGDLDVDPWHVLPAAAEAPRHQPHQLVEAVVLAHKWTAAVALENIFLILTKHD